MSIVSCKTSSRKPTIAIKFPDKSRTEQKISSLKLEIQYLKKQISMTEQRLEVLEHAFHYGLAPDKLKEQMQTFYQKYLDGDKTNIIKK